MEHRKLKPRNNFEERVIQKREKEQQHERTWGGAVKYYDRMSKHASKFEEWTSPRYYAANNELMSEIRLKKDKEELLEKRRENLKKLLMEDARTYEIELMIKNNSPRDRARFSKYDEIPVDVLRDVSEEIKSVQETRRRTNAEQSLYRTWRANDPILREHASNRSTKDLKLSWLDQQIEKRMAKERETEYTRKLIKERDARIAEQTSREQETQVLIETRVAQLKTFLEKQMEEFREKERRTKELNDRQATAINRLACLEELESQRALEVKSRETRLCSLANLREYRRKLELKSKEIETQLESDKAFLAKLKSEELSESLERTHRNALLKESMEKFAALLDELKTLETKRKPHVLFTFESEAKDIYRQFEATWRKEQDMRDELMKEVIREVRHQIDANLESFRHAQRLLLGEKEDALKQVEKYNDELKELKEIEARKKVEFRRELDDQIKENTVCKKKLERLESKRVDDELDLIRDEEEKLKREIAKLQMGKSVSTHGRKRFFY